MIRLYDAEGDLVAEDDNGGDGLNALLSFLSESGGVYYVQVAAAGGTRGEYTLSVGIEGGIVRASAEATAPAAPAQGLSRASTVRGRA